MFLTASDKFHELIFPDSIIISLWCLKNKRALFYEHFMRTKHLLDEIFKTCLRSAMLNSWFMLSICVRNYVFLSFSIDFRIHQQRYISERLSLQNYETFISKLSVYFSWFFFYWKSNTKHLCLYLNVMEHGF